MKQIRARLTVLLFCVALVTFSLSVLIFILIRSGVILERDTVEHILFGYAVRDFLLLLLAASVSMSIMLIRRSRMLKAREADLTKALIQRDKLLAIARASVDGKSNAAAAEKIMSEELQPPLIKLTPRELEIAHLAGQGLMNKEIASILKISPQTVGVHKNNLYRKLGVSNNIELLRYLQEVGL